MKLIIAPHADDETLGCGGIIARDPDDVTVAVLSDKDDGRMEEFRLARKILGYDSFYAPTFATGSLAANSRAVTGVLDTIIREVKPTELYLPTPGAHQDHIAAYECGIRAARLSYTDNSWFVPAVFLYQIPSYSLDLYAIPYNWDRFLPLSVDQMDLKCAAIRAYSSQSTGAFDPCELARSTAAYAGSQVNVMFAEQLATVRCVA